MIMIITSFIGAWLLLFSHLPAQIMPAWPIIVLLYYARTTPDYINVGVAWLIGCLLDLFYAVPIGTNAIVLVVATYFMISFSRAFSLLPLFKKSVIMLFIFLWCILVPQILITILMGAHINMYAVIGRAITSTLLWLGIAKYFEKN